MAKSSSVEPAATSYMKAAVNVPSLGVSVGETHAARTPMKENDRLPGTGAGPPTCKADATCTTGLMVMWTLIEPETAPRPRRLSATGTLTAGRRWPASLGCVVEGMARIPETSTAEAGPIEAGGAAAGMTEAGVAEAGVAGAVVAKAEAGVIQAVGAAASATGAAVMAGTGRMPPHTALRRVAPAWSLMRYASSDIYVPRSNRLGLPAGPPSCCDRVLHRLTPLCLPGL